MSALRRWVEAALGVPFTKECGDAQYARLTDGLDEHAALERILAGITHATEKAGALLAAQAMFLVVALFAVDHGWPRELCVPAMLLLLGAALIVTSILRGVSPGRNRDDSRPIPRQAIDLLHHRMVRFNISLYLTFLSICLLGVGAIAML